MELLIDSIRELVLPKRLVRLSEYRDGVLTSRFPMMGQKTLHKIFVEATLTDMLYQIPVHAVMHFEVHSITKKILKLPKEFEGVPIKVNNFVKEYEVTLRPFLL